MPADDDPLRVLTAEITAIRHDIAALKNYVEDRIATLEKRRSFRVAAPMKGTTTLGKVIAILTDEPHNALPLWKLREKTNKNNLADAIALGVANGQLVQGVLLHTTPRAGRPQKVIALADKPLLTLTGENSIAWDAPDMPSMPSKPAKPDWGIPEPPPPPRFKGTFHYDRCHHLPSGLGPCHSYCASIYGSVHIDGKKIPFTKDEAKALRASVAMLSILRTVAPQQPLLGVIQPLPPTICEDCDGIGCSTCTPDPEHEVVQ